uniref:NADH dehydrogenase [ubiquinone] 1 beta subcomplex subunit 5, mitochondrial n=1 Tax=Lynceus sp. MCZ IZ 141354 TaxID=1930659 RepID=A0A9N6WZE8_9CRUS|nr:EOG090X0FIE [Lynceus sp. MCZ IZ 141354]
MVAFSSLIRSASTTVVKCSPNTLLMHCRQMSGGGHHNFQVKPSRWQWNKFKDYLHFYFMLGFIPVSIFVFCVNVFVGPATLSEIPEGYKPKPWEYEKHPISRFIARYMIMNHQQSYELKMHNLFEEEYKRQLRLLEWKVRDKMGERGDYKAFYYIPVDGRYAKFVKETSEADEHLKGEP